MCGKRSFCSSAQQLRTLRPKMFWCFLCLSLVALGQTLPIGRNLLDLSYLYDENVVYYPGYPPFKSEESFKGFSASGIWFTAKNFCGPEHGGTHMDAPYHFYEEGWKIDEIPFERFVAPAVVVDIRSKALSDPNAAMDVSDLQHWEEQYGRIPNGSVVLVNSGHGAKWGNQTAFLGLTSTANVSDISSAGTVVMNYPGIGPDAAEFLVANRSIVGVGVDTISLDPANEEKFPAHVTILSHNLFGLENVANLDHMPASGATLYILPMKIKGGSGAPTRILAKF